MMVDGVFVVSKTKKFNYEIVVGVVQITTPTTKNCLFPLRLCGYNSSEHRRCYNLHLFVGDHRNPILPFAPMRLCVRSSRKLRIFRMLENSSPQTITRLQNTEGVFLICESVAISLNFPFPHPSGAQSPLTPLQVREGAKIPFNILSCSTL
jgi:hypothetical protein